MASPRKEHPVISPTSAKHLFSCLRSVLALHPSALTTDFLSTLNISTCPSIKTPSWLPRPNTHPDCATLDLPTKTAPWIGHAPYTGLEWACQYDRTAGLLAESETPTPIANVARVRPMQPTNPWERLIAVAEYSMKGWEMVNILETRETPASIGCIVADDSRTPADTGNTSQPYGQGELACLLSLICRQISQDHHKTKHAPTVISFSTSTARVLQIFVDYPIDPSETPKIHIIQRFETDLTNTTTEAGDTKEARDLWTQLVSWLCFSAPSAPNEPSRTLPKHRRDKSLGHSSLASASEPERVVSSGSEQSTNASSSPDRESLRGRGEGG
ncbi:hypothetical protein K456DRAFT_1767047 [Colletotrichum gloeosporioides 23]|nr:hypothetical protein K456DRAFT_1767047 [Colletotrichum gloeosporioides 23]